MFSGRTTTTISAPAPGPMDLNSSRPDWRELLPLFLVSLLGVIVFTFGALLVVLFFPTDESDMAAWRVVVVLAGGGFAYGGYAWFRPLSSTVGRSEARHYARIDEWHAAQLEKYVEGDGQLVAQQVSEWAYNPLDLRSLLLGYVAVMATNPAKLTIEELTRNGLWLTIDHRMVKVLTFTQDSAAQFLDLMAEAKVIEGRGPRVAGRVLIAQPREQVLRLLKTAARAPEVQAALAAQEGL